MAKRETLTQQPVKLVFNSGTYILTPTILFHRAQTPFLREYTGSDIYKKSYTDAKFKFYSSRRDCFVHHMLSGAPGIYSSGDQRWLRELKERGY